MQKTSAADAVTDGIVEKLVQVNRNSKTVKGGRQMGFSAIVVVGDGKGKVGYGRGKAREVPAAIQKATENARRSMVKIPLKGTTIQHKIVARHGASKVLMLPASEGTGVIAGNAMRAVFEVMGVENILAKCIGSTTPINVIRATVKGLTEMMTPERVAEKRGKTVKQVLEGVTDYE
jgi:small subunit ribosomal protein S5